MKSRRLLKNFIPRKIIMIRRLFRDIFVRLETLERNQLNVRQEKYGSEIKSEINNK